MASDSLLQLLFESDLRKRFLDFCYAFDLRPGLDSLAASGLRM